MAKAINADTRWQLSIKKIEFSNHFKSSLETRRKIF